MKTILLVAVLPASFVAVFAITPTAAEIPYGSMGAVGAIGATLLLIVGRYLPNRDKLHAEAMTSRDKLYTESIVKVTDRFAKSMDAAEERGDKLVRELVLKSKE